MLRFFDYHLRGIDDGFTDKPPVRYYTMGEERWKFSDTWPPPGAQWRSYFLAPDNRLSLDASTVEAKHEANPEGRGATHDIYEVDESAATGQGSRWGLIVGTGDKREDKDRRLLTYTSSPLESALEITGHPIVRLYVSANATDGAVFVYLEDVHPNGEVTYVTEGQLPAIHRRLGISPIENDPVPFHTFVRADARPLVPGEVAELVFDLLPTSFLFQDGHSIRVAIAGAGQFDAPLPVSPLIYEVHRDLIHPSRIELPTYPAAPRLATR